jgi:hypothetical protein
MYRLIVARRARAIFEALGRKDTETALKDTGWSGSST